MKELILVRSHMNVLFVKESLVETRIESAMKKLTSIGKHETVLLVKIYHSLSILSLNFYTLRITKLKNLKLKKTILLSDLKNFFFPFSLKSFL